MANIFLKKEHFEEIFKSHLKIETYSKRIESLYSERFFRKINYKPYYQRNYVWDKHKASYFIESILLGTEIPPLIFFNNGKTIEVIDGRQRFETINKFRNNEFFLTKKGLFTFKQLAKKNYSDIVNEFNDIGEIFLDAKIRIIEFEIVNKSDLDPYLEDKIKKEIFARYNSGITPLKRPEIDNAIYDKEAISGHFKSELKKDSSLCNLIYSIFFKQQTTTKSNPPLDNIMQFIRRYLVLHNFPIIYYARGTSRTELLTKYFEYLGDTYNDIDELYSNFVEKIKIIDRIKSEFSATQSNQNRLVFECLLWALFVLENESIDIRSVNDDKFIEEIVSNISKNIDKYTEQNSHYFNEIMNRYSFTAELFRSKFDVNFKLYIDGNYSSRESIKLIKKRKLDLKNLEDIESLRLTKPDPSRASIVDILDVMKRDRFLVRPSYQRSEVINLPKASAIIESILLGVMLPAIFIYKRNDGVSEVIDGQQRLLTILGFLGKSYFDDDGKTRVSKNHKFKLRNLRILEEHKSKTFDQLSEDDQDKILDFELFLVEIEERLNTEFNPIDLFIRLNDKPYPIRENSFEMWNSWVDKDIISKIREYVKINLDWFYIKSKKQIQYRDRMENEELFTLLAYLDFRKTNNKENMKYLEIYQKGDRINARVRDKKDVTSVMGSISEDIELKEAFLCSIENILEFINKLIIIFKPVLTDRSNLNESFEQMLELVFKAGKTTRNYRRTLQDFYILWVLVNNLGSDSIENNEHQLIKDIKSIFIKMKNIDESEILNNLGYESFINAIEKFDKKYKYVSV